jgi:hypothetical protein
MLWFVWDEDAPGQTELKPPAIELEFLSGGALEG